MLACNWTVVRKIIKLEGVSPSPADFQLFPLRGAAQWRSFNIHFLFSVEATSQRETFVGRSVPCDFVELHLTFLPLGFGVLGFVCRSTGQHRNSLNNPNPEPLEP